MANLTFPWLQGTQLETVDLSYNEFQVNYNFPFTK